MSKRFITLATAFLVAVSVFSIGSVRAASPAQAQVVTTVSTVAELESAVASSQSGDTILIEPGSYQLTDELGITSAGLTVAGAGTTASDVVLLAANNDRVFLVGATASSTTIGNLTITGGHLNNAEGGGVRVEAGGVLNLVDAEIIDNFADQGGGLSNEGTVTIAGSLFEANEARRKGGGIETSGTLTVLNSTFTGNVGKGGGALSTAGGATLSFVTIAGNRSTNKIGAGAQRNGGTLSIRNSIVANNLGSDDAFHDCSGTPDLVNALVTSAQGCNPVGPVDVIASGTALEPAPPVDNGGPTRTLALLPTSPAIDYSTDCTSVEGTVISIDQRGVGRVDGLCDLGAYEIDRIPPDVFASASPPANAAGWNNSPVTVTITASEGGSLIEYSTDGGTSWTSYVGPLLVADEGTTTITYRASDSDGNTSEPGALTVNIDTTAPVVSAATSDGATEGDILLSLTATDDPGTGLPFSGVALIEWTTEPVDSGDPDAANWNTYTGEVLITQTTTVSYRATDLADNTGDPEAVTLTIEPLSFDVSMSTSSSEVEVGAVVVPVENIGTAIQAAAGSGTTTASTPLSSLPLASLPLSSLPLSSLPLSSLPLSSLPLSSLPLASLPLSSLPLSSLPLSSLPLSSLDTVLDCANTTCPEDTGLEVILVGTALQGTPLQSLNFTDLVAVPLSSLPLSSLPLSSIPLSSLPLSSIPLSSLDAVIDCDAIAGGCATPNTLLDAFNANAVVGGTIGDVLSFEDLSFGATPLASLPLSSLALGTTPLSSIPLSSLLVPPATDAERLAEWCSVLGYAPGSDGCLLVESSGTNLMTLALAGAPLSSLPLSSIPLSSLPLSSLPLSSLPLSSLSWSSTPLSSLPLSSLPLSSLPLSSLPLSSLPLSSLGDFVDCSLVDCSTGTLGDAATNGAFLVNTLGELAPVLTAGTVGDLEGWAELDAYSLADLLFGLLTPTEVPWEEIDLNRARLPDAADPKQPSFTYDIELVVGGARSADIAVDLTPPVGFYFARDLATSGPLYPADPDFPTTLDGIAVTDPTEDLATGTLSLSLSNVPPGTHLLSVAMRAGVVLGEHTASVTAAATTTQDGPLAAGPATASIVVTEAGEGSGPIPALVNGELNLSHIGSTNDLDLYEFFVDDNLAGASARILLSNLPDDYDLVLYGPPVAAPLRGAPTPGFGLVEDFVFDLNPDDEILDTDTLGDVPHDPAKVGLTEEVLNSVSGKRGTTNEEITTGTLRPGRYVVQVSSYNGVFNDLPFGLRIQLSENAEKPCSVPPLALGTRGTLPTVFPAELNTLFLYNHARLLAAYPTDAQQVLDELNRVATSDWTDLGVIGAVVPVDGDNGVWTALAGDGVKPGLANDRCNPQASNDVMREIGSLIDGIMAAHPQVENIVIIGDDGQIPMARIPDGTFYSNEREHGAGYAGNNELVGALGNGFYLSDVPYGTAAGIAVNDHEFFVPDLAVGRLVETPDQIAKALGNFVFYDGKLDPSTAAAASGYDFISDGTDQIREELIAEGFSIGQTPADGFLNSETWSRQDLIDLLAVGPAVAALNAHFDESRALPALGNSQNDESDLFTVTDIPAGLNRAVLFSVGCHAGLSKSDVQLGAPSPDWAQSFADLDQSIWAANTGYGYGDTKLVALSEELAAGFASRLGSFPIGKAWQLAMQEYAGDLFTLTPYDEKVLQEFTLYGLPMYVTGPADGVAPSQPPAAGTGPVTFTDPFTALQSSSVTTALQLGGTALSGPGYLHRVETSDGDFYEVDGETLEVRGRPVQPRTGTDVTKPDGAGGLASVAGGALITGLTGLQETGFDPLIFTPVVDLGDATANSVVDAFRPEAGDATFPAGIQRISTYEDDDGQVRQRLLQVPGRFVAEGPDGTNTQELFTEIQSLVYYRDPGSSDLTAPEFRQSIGRFGDGVVHFEVDVAGEGATGSDDVERVYVLFRPDGAVGLTTWQGVDLVRVPGTNTWLGGRPVEPFTGTDYEFLVQAVDSNGNVSMSDAKGINFLTSEPTESAFILIDISGDFSAETGWYRDASVSATTQASGATITSYRIDFGPDTPWDGSSLPISGDGGHLIQVYDSAGNQGLTFVAVDATGPLAFAGFAPPPTDNGWNGGDVIVTMDAVDPFGSGVASILYSTDGLEPSTEYTGPFSVPDEGIHTVRYLATDAVGNQGAEGSPLTIQVDLTAPDVSAVVPTTTTGWYNGPVEVALSADDPASGVVTIEYRLDPNDPWQMYLGPFQVASEGATTIYFRATDAVGNTGDGQFDVGSLEVQLDLTAPIVTITVPMDGAEYGQGSTPPAPVFDCTDPAGGSGIATCVEDGPIDTSTLGAKTFSVTGTDVAGNATTETVTYTVVDDAAPTVAAVIDPPANGAGWNTTAVTVTITGSDGSGSGIAGIEYSTDGGATWLPYSTPFSWGTEGATTILYRATDVAGNTSATGSLDINIDTIAPTIASALDGGFFVLDEIATVSFDCSDVGSGIDTCVGSVAHGGAVDTSDLGTFDFQVTATDVAGSITVSTFTYTVGYGICLLYDPLKEQPATGTVVIKLELCDASGTRVTGPARTLVATLIDGDVVPSPNDTGSSNPDMEFRYDNQGKRYIYNLNVDELTDQGGNPVGLLPGYHTMGFTINGVAADSYQAGFTLK